MSLFIYVAVMKAVLVAVELRKKGTELFLKGGGEVQLRAFKQDSFGNRERVGRLFTPRRLQAKTVYNEHHSSTTLLCTSRLQSLNIYKVGSIAFSQTRV